MAFDLAQPERGCLLLADITGFTGYMAGTELAHSQDVVADLLEVIVASIEPTFTLSKLEGDAAFAYAALDSVNPSMVMDTVETAYFNFQKRLRDVVHATSCPCDACILIPNLDLKFFVHDGEYIVRHIARSEELAGSDVILVHRLAKGGAGAAIGTPAYAVYTKATLDSMAMDPTILGFTAYTEHFDDVGDVPVYVQNLAVRWAFEQERNRDYVTSADAVYEASMVTTAAPATIWDHLTDPAKRPSWQRHVDAVLTQTDGRRGIGTVNHCMHGPDVILEHVADWRPFSYITLRYSLGEISDWAWTIELNEVPEGMQVTMRLADPGPGMWEAVGETFSESVDTQLSNLEEVLAGATV